jgi:TonB family protein
VEGRVFVSFVVDAEGRMIDPKIRENKNKPIDPILSEAVMAAAKQWTFSPALNAGKPEPRAVGVTVSFYLKGRGNKPSVDLPLMLEVAPTKPAKPLLQADPMYPDELLARKLPGAAEFEFQISAEGKAEDIKVLYASDAAFVPAGLATVRSWTFEPGRQGPLPVPTSKRSTMDFYVQGDQVSPEDLLAANGISGLASNDVSKAPTPERLAEPVYPRARLVAGETGEADVEFVIAENGATEFVALMASSHPEFGAALVAAVETWRFRPAFKGTERARVTLRVRQTFALKDPAADPAGRLAAALKDGAIAGARGLDRPLKPIWRIPPRYPAALLAEKPAGESVIEFIIDREGRARLPRVVSATHEAFGWAAATAISQWVFEPPMRGGQAADVLVSIPVNFARPTD